MKLLLFTGFLLVFVCLTKAEPECHSAELFKCIDIAISWLHSLPKSTIPVTDDEVNTMCTEVGKTIDCAMNFRDRCMTPLQKEVIQLLTEGSFELRKSFCTAGSEMRQKYLEHSGCINKVSQMDEVKGMIEYGMATLEKLQNVKPQDAITSFCCGYNRVINDILDLEEKTCGKEAKEVDMEFLSMAVAQLPEVICSGYTGREDHCVALLPPEGSKPSNDAQKTKIYQYFRNVLQNWLD